MTYLLSTSCKICPRGGLAEIISTEKVLSCVFGVVLTGKMSSGGAPESWDQDVSNNLSKLNVNATEFVPSWGPPPQVPKQSAVTSTEPSKNQESYFLSS